MAFLPGVDPIIESAAGELLQRINYQGGRVDLELVCRVAPFRITPAPAPCAFTHQDLGVTIFVPAADDAARRRMLAAIEMGRACIFGPWLRGVPLLARSTQEDDVLLLFAGCLLLPVGEVVDPDAAVCAARYEIPEQLAVSRYFYESQRDRQTA